MADATDQRWFRVALGGKEGKIAVTSSRLAVCHQCERIGDWQEATLHAAQTGHEIEVLAPDIAEAVRHEQEHYQGQRVAALIEYARMRKAAGR